MSDCKRGTNEAQGLAYHWCMTHNAEWLLSDLTCSGSPTPLSTSKPSALRAHLHRLHVEIDQDNDRTSVQAVYRDYGCSECDRLVLLNDTNKILADLLREGAALSGQEARNWNFRHWQDKAKRALGIET